MPPLFGTDGIRGIANQPPMTADCALALAQAAATATQQAGDQQAGERRVVIGRDTRRSGVMLEAALSAGFTSAGMDVLIAGVLPTPAVACLAKAYHCALGVVISASHNPYWDNGIKFFGPEGNKLSIKDESLIEACWQSDPELLAKPESVGIIRHIEEEAGNQYLALMRRRFPNGDTDFTNLNLVLDCAHGAAFKIAPRLFADLGAHVIAIGTEPNGCNINLNCGAMMPAVLGKHVRESGANLGIAFDGDADRMVLCDEKGEVLNGDYVLALIAEAWQQDGRLRGGAVVTTHMSNLGLELYLAKQGINLLRTDIGDRHVAACMRASGCNLGGEPSGHILLPDHASTGDGLLAAVHALSLLVMDGRPISQAARRFAPLPQISRNISCHDADPVLQSSRVRDAIKAAEKTLNQDGRLLVRPSGTEPFIRVMVEGKNIECVEQVCHAIERVLIYEIKPAISLEKALNKI